MQTPMEGRKSNGSTGQANGRSNWESAGNQENPVAFEVGNTYLLFVYRPVSFVMRGSVRISRV
jgi:hypothetical protein